VGQCVRMAAGSSARGRRTPDNAAQSFMFVASCLSNQFALPVLVDATASIAAACALVGTAAEGNCWGTPLRSAPVWRQIRCAMLDRLLHRGTFSNAVLGTGAERPLPPSNRSAAVRGLCPRTPGITALGQSGCGTGRLSPPRTPSLASHGLHAGCSRHFN